MQIQNIPRITERSIGQRCAGDSDSVGMRQICNHVSDSSSPTSCYFLINSLFQLAYLWVLCESPLQLPFGFSSPVWFCCSYLLLWIWFAGCFLSTFSLPV